MQSTNLNLDTLISTMLSDIKAYGILEVSTRQYHTVCNQISRYAAEKGAYEYSEDFASSYLKFIEKRYINNEICTEYLRFQKRVLRMLSSLSNTGQVDFSPFYNKKKYRISNKHIFLVYKILDDNKLTGESREEIDTVLRHIFVYVEAKGLNVHSISDDLLMEFITTEMPITNKGSIGRTLRGIRYLSDYLKVHHIADLVLDFSQLKVKTNSAKMILPYTKEEVKKILESIDKSTSLGIRDYAIILLGFYTGLRGVDIKGLCLSDIDWKNGQLKIRQSKTTELLVLPLEGAVMNALADYILQVRPQTDYKEIFLTVKEPTRPLRKRAYPFTSMIHKYCDKAGVTKKSLRAFHSLRRSFATELSMAEVPITMISELLGHKKIDEDKPYLSYNRNQIAFCAMNFDEIPIESGIYASFAKLNYAGGTD